jgi:hypothetical protein
VIVEPGLLNEVAPPEPDEAVAVDGLDTEEAVTEATQGSELLDGGAVEGGSQEQVDGAEDAGTSADATAPDTPSDAGDAKGGVSAGDDPA